VVTGSVVIGLEIVIPDDYYAKMLTHSLTVYIKSMFMSDICIICLTVFGSGNLLCFELKIGTLITRTKGSAHTKLGFTRFLPSVSTACLTDNGLVVGGQFSMPLVAISFKLLKIMPKLS